MCILLRLLPSVGTVVVLFAIGGPVSACAQGALPSVDRGASFSRHLPWSPVAAPQVGPTLPFTFVRTLFQDSRGDFWFGSNNDGVSRYDGRTFETFTTKQGLASNQIRTIQEDQLGHIWFGTGRGISRFDGTSITTLTDSDSWTVRKPINRNTEPDPRWATGPHDLWFDAGINSGVYRWDGTTLSYLPFPIPATERDHDLQRDPYTVFAIAKTSARDVWFGTSNRGVIHFDGTTFTILDREDLRPFVRSIFKATDGTLWFGNNGGGVIRYDGRDLTNLSVQHGLTNDTFQAQRQVSDQPGTLARVWSIEQDADGSLWFGTVDAGAWRYADATLTPFTSKDGLPDSPVWIIYRDRQNTLWFGTEDGAFQFNGKAFTPFIPDPSQ